MGEPAETVRTSAVKPSRRSLLKLSGFGLGLAAVGSLGGVASAHDRDRGGASGRGDGATVAELSTASSLRILWRVETDQSVMALTFDDGPSDVLTPRLLASLRAEKVRATFCLVGQHAARRPDLVRQQSADGHELANHTWSHPDLSLLSYPAVKRELERTDDLLEKLSGIRPALIRPPYGRVDGALLQHAAINSQSVLLWDLRFHEATYDTPGNARYVLDHLRPGSVLLGHDAGTRNRCISIDAIPAVIRGAKELGFEFLTGSEMLALDAARSSRSV